MTWLLSYTYLFCVGSMGDLTGTNLLGCLTNKSVIVVKLSKFEEFEEFEEFEPLEVLVTRSIVVTLSLLLSLFTIIFLLCIFKLLLQLLLLKFKF